MAGRADRLTIGNLDSKRDWGHARDYVKAMWMMLQQDKPEDFVIATAKQYSVRQLITLCFELVGISIEWRGEGISEEGVNKETNKVLVQVSEKYFRPTEVETLLGDCSKAKKELGWTPETSFKKLVHEMMESDMKSNGLELPDTASIMSRQDE